MKPPPSAALLLLLGLGVGCAHIPPQVKEASRKHRAALAAMGRIMRTDLAKSCREQAVLLESPSHEKDG